jgi:FkbM family methyltransferase
MIVIQLGTNNGNDHVRDLCKSQHPNLVILVEPFSRHNTTILENYKGIENVNLINKAILAEKQDRVELYYTELDGKIRGPTCSYLVTSTLKSHLHKHGYTDESIEAFTVEALTLEELFTNFNLTEIDYLFIDIEGIDFDVLKSINFEKYKINHIQIEHIHLDKEGLNRFMAEKKYYPKPGLDHHGYDTLYVLS